MILFFRTLSDIWRRSTCVGGNRLQVDAFGLKYTSIDAALK
ncbi:hypothetical protein D3OALGB2SA_556 [Olavius algarvensis associated proteobacterium Delta 3]|nr:hypothetical protein D3OALGB2SA_556 [Olavius algarvensis associated proteobacterium Delta 3]